MKNILVIGSLNMDCVTNVPHMPVAGETILAKRMDFIPGGKGANQAYAVGKLQGNVSMLGMVGNDAHGEKLCNNLADVGVNVSRIRKLDNISTGTAAIVVDPQGENSIIVIQGANAYVDIGYIQENMDLIEASDIVVLQLEIPLETVIYAAKEAKRLEKTVILDPAPAVPDIPDELLACVDVIKPNETELSVLLGCPCKEQNLHECARMLQNKGVRNVLITLGGEGSYLLKEDQTEKRLPAVKTARVVDTTAAGDSYVAALAVALSRGEALEDAIQLASQVSSIVVTRAGAQTSIPSLEEVMDEMLR